MKTKDIYVLFLFASLVIFGCRKDQGLGSFLAKDPSLQFNAEQLDVPKNDSTYQIKFQSNLPWRATSNNDWITVNDSTDSGLEGDSILIFKVSKNPTIQPRSGSFTVYITKEYQKIITINQAAGDPPPIIKRNVYVKVGASGNGDSWATATSLSSALAMDLSEGDSIHVAAGTYKPETLITGGTAGDNGDKTFEIKQNIVIVGGYPANAAEGSIANPTVNSTILDGDNIAYHVVTVSAPTITNQKVQIKGVTIKQGNTASSGSATISGLSFPKNYGGGLIVGKATVELEECIITDNTSVSGGGAVYCFTNADLILKETTVQNNKTTASGANGGAIFMDKQSNLFMYNSTITNNAAGSFAGALYQYTGSFHIYNSTIDGNGAGGLGSTVTGKAYGGIYLREGNGDLINCTVYGNTASNIGGGVGAYGTASAPSILNIVSSTITANKVKSGSAGGAGLYVNALSCTINIYNSIISGNTRGATGTETVSEVEGVVGFAWNKKYSVIVGQVFNNNGVEVSGATFDPAAMLGTLANNGGTTKTVQLLGSANPAMTNGMPANELATLGNSFSTVVPSVIITNDQIGGSRSNKAYIGALVK